MSRPNGQKVVDFTVPSAFSSSQIRRAVDGAFSSVEALMTPSVWAATGQTGNFTFNAAQKQAVVDATDAIIKHAGDVLDADTATHGYMVFTASPTGSLANYRKIDVSKIDDNLYGQTPGALDALFNRQDLTVTKTGFRCRDRSEPGPDAVVPTFPRDRSFHHRVPYLMSHLPGGGHRTLLTVGDGQTVPKVGGMTRMAGIPDGLGAYDNGDGTFTVLMNHEIVSPNGATRDHGAEGRLRSEVGHQQGLRHQVLSGDDLIEAGLYLEWLGYTAAASPVAFDRLCSADLPAPSALYNTATGSGSVAALTSTVKNSAGGQAYAHVVDGPDAGRAITWCIRSHQLRERLLSPEGAGEDIGDHDQ